MKFRFIPALAPVLLAACSSTHHCVKEQDYQKAKTVAPIQSVDPLKIPESPSALRVPPAAPGAARFGEKVHDKGGDEKWRCLDIPPTFDETAEAEKAQAAALNPIPATPAPVAAPAPAPAAPPVPTPDVPAPTAPPSNPALPPQPAPPPAPAPSNAPAPPSSAPQP